MQPPSLASERVKSSLLKAIEVEVREYWVEVAGNCTGIHTTVVENTSGRFRSRCSSEFEFKYSEIETEDDNPNSNPVDGLREGNLVAVVQVVTNPVAGRLLGNGVGVKGSS